MPNLGSVVAAAAVATLAPIFVGPAAAHADTPGVTVQPAVSFPVDAALLGLIFEGLPPTTGPVQVSVDRVTIPPGGSLTWHNHGGPVYTLVLEGTLTRKMADCSTVASGFGSFVLEPSGVHTDMNLGTTPLVLIPHYMTPMSASVTTSAPAPDCAA